MELDDRTITSLSVNNREKINYRKMNRASGTRAALTKSLTFMPSKPQWETANAGKVLKEIITENLANLAKYVKLQIQETT